jgi:membrane-bound lytic murein transglycosylase D
MKHNIQRAFKIYGIIVIAFATVAILSSISAGNEDSLEDRKVERLYLPQIIKAIDLDRDFDFAGELLPMDNFDVLERLDREILVNAYQHATTMMNIKHAKRYFPLFERILSTYGIPEDFKYLAVAESNFRLGTSTAGAKGIWQFMPTTAKGYGLEISDEVDERLHTEKSTEAACKLIMDYKKRFNSWTMAASAYNLGETRMAKEINAQKSSSFFDLNLNAETSRYIFRVVAIKEIMSNPKIYGFHLEDEDFYQPLNDFKTVEVNSTINSLSDFAESQGVSYRMLKVYNPWLIASRLTIKPGKTYTIKLPV